MPPRLRVYSLVLDTYIVIAGAEETMGQFSMFEAVIPPGGGPPPHRHLWEDEAFYVLEGSVAFTIEGQLEEALPGSFFRLPRGKLHSFKNNGTSPARLMFITIPGGFEKFLEDCAKPLPHRNAKPDPLTADEFESIIERAPLYGLELPRAF